MTNKKVIWLVNFYSSTLDKGIGGRCYYFAKYLAKLGYDVYLFSSSSHHLLREKPVIPDGADYLSEKVDGFNYIWLKTPRYATAHSKFRLLSEIFFSFKLRNLYKKDFPRPYSIFFSAPGILTYPGAHHLAKVTKAKLVYDVRDLWPLTLIEMGGVSPKHPLVYYMHRIQNKAHTTADAITSNWPYAIDYMEKHGADRNKFTWLPNGFSAEEFSNSEKIDTQFLERLPKDKFIIGYTGTLGQANALGALLNTAELLKSYNDIAFVIVGDGREKEDLIDEIAVRSLSNVYYVGSVPKRKIPAVLSLFDVCYVGFLDIPLYRLGSSLTKLPEYLASKKPIIYASSSPFQPVQNCGAGISVQAENYSEISAAVLQLYAMSDSERLRMGEAGFKEAILNYDYEVLTKTLEKVLVL